MDVKERDLKVREKLSVVLLEVTDSEVLVQPSSEEDQNSLLKLTEKLTRHCQGKLLIRVGQVTLYRIWATLV